MASGFVNRRPTRLFTTGLTTSATYTTSASVGPVTDYTFTSNAYCVASMYAISSALGSAGTAQPAFTFTPLVGGAVTVSAGSITLNANAGTASTIQQTAFVAKSGSAFTHTLAWSGVTGSAVVAYAVVLEVY